MTRLEVEEFLSKYYLPLRGILMRGGIDQHSEEYFQVLDCFIRFHNEVRSETIKLLASSVKKFAPDISKDLIKRYNESENALENFLAFLRKED